MEMKRILELAYEAALDRWYTTHIQLEENPDSERIKKCEHKYWKEMFEIENMRKRLAQKEDENELAWEVYPK